MSHCELFRAEQLPISQNKMIVAHQFRFRCEVGT